VALSGASNVLGTVNNIREIAQICHNYGVRLLVDAAQLAAHKPIDMQGLGIDYLVFSAHKIYAPFGSGGIIAREGLLPDKFFSRCNNPKTANIIGIAALGKALVLLKRIGMELIERHERDLTAHALERLQHLGRYKVIIYGQKNPTRLDNRVGVISFNVVGIYANEVARELEALGGIGTRYGCFCAHILIRWLLRQQKGRGVDKEQVRISFGLYNTREEIDYFIRILKMTHAIVSESAMIQNLYTGWLINTDNKTYELLNEIRLRVYGPPNSESTHRSKAGILQNAQPSPSCMSTIKGWLSRTRKVNMAIAQAA
jgi:selenocysteine lyase/cysteine desulfurase